MKKFLFRIILPAIVLAVVYHYGYSAGRSSGIRTSSAMPPIISAPVSVPSAPIATAAPKPKVIETPEVSQPMQPPMPTVKRVRQTPEGLVVENRPVQALPSVPRSDKAVFRAPNISGVQPGTSEPIRDQNHQPELQPLKSVAAPKVLPPLAKPQVAPQDNDCGCGK